MRDVGRREAVGHRWRLRLPGIERFVLSPFVLDLRFVVVRFAVDGPGFCLGRERRRHLVLRPFDEVQRLLEGLRRDRERLGGSLVLRQALGFSLSFGFRTLARFAFRFKLRLRGARAADDRLGEEWRFERLEGVGGKKCGAEHVGSCWLEEC